MHRVRPDVIVLLCGPPASGKTTLANGLADRLRARGVQFELLHSDDFRRDTYDRMYDQVVGSDTNWLLDGTFYERGDQERFRALDGASLVWIRVGRDTALARNETREDAIDETGLHVMHSSFDEPDADLVIDTDELAVSEALDRLEAAVNDWLDGE